MAKEKQSKENKIEASSPKGESSQRSEKLRSKSESGSKKQPKEEISKKQQPKELDEHEILVRILTYDLPGSRGIYPGLTLIKGVSWTIAKSICTKLNIPLNKKVGDISPEEIKKIEEFIKQPDIADFLKNRRYDPETGESKHLQGSDLDLRKDFDIKRLRQIKSYKGVRHAAKLPVRGQRTRSNFRAKGKAVGVKRKAK